MGDTKEGNMQHQQEWHVVSCKKLSFIIVSSGFSFVLQKLEDSHYSDKPRGNTPPYVELNQACGMLGPFVDNLP